MTATPMNPLGNVVLVTLMLPQIRRAANKASTTSGSERVPWWSVRVRGSDGQVQPRQPRATKQRTRNVASTESRSNERRGFFNIRVRGQESLPEPVPAAETAPAAAPAVAAVVEQRNLNSSSQPTTTSPTRTQSASTSTSVRPTATPKHKTC